MSTVTAKVDRAPETQSRRFETLIGLVWALVTFYAAYRVSLYVFLLRLYGFARVRGEHLHFTDTPKGGAWIVSNGDRITDGQFFQFAVGLVLWLVLFSVTFWFIHRLLPSSQHNAG